MTGMDHHFCFWPLIVRSKSGPAADQCRNMNRCKARACPWLIIACLSCYSSTGRTGNTIDLWLFSSEASWGTACRPDHTRHRNDFAHQWSGRCPLPEMQLQSFPQDPWEKYEWYGYRIPDTTERDTIAQYFKNLSHLQVEENCIVPFDFWASTSVCIKWRPVDTQLPRVQGDALQCQLYY